MNVKAALPVYARGCRFCVLVHHDRLRGMRGTRFINVLDIASKHR